MKTKFLTLLLLLLIGSCSLFVSCKNDKHEIALDNSDTVALAPDISWAVVVEPYAAFRKEASWSSATKDHCRFGEVLMVEGKLILPSEMDSKSMDVWYRFDKGWLSETSVSVYQNKLKAQKASESMLK